MTDENAEPVARDLMDALIESFERAKRERMRIERENAAGSGDAS